MVLFVAPVMVVFVIAAAVVCVMSHPLHSR